MVQLKTFFLLHLLFPPILLYQLNIFKNIFYLIIRLNLRKTVFLTIIAGERLAKFLKQSYFSFNSCSINKTLIFKNENCIWRRELWNYIIFIRFGKYFLKKYVKKYFKNVYSILSLTNIFNVTYKHWAFKNRSKFRTYPWEKIPILKLIISITLPIYCKS